VSRRAAAPGSRRIALVAGAVVALLPSATAWAWQVADPIHHDCHERISAAALADVGYVKAPPPLTGADSDLRDGLQFDAGRYDANIYALSLIIGARWPDSQGAPSFDFYKLSNVHNAPGDQGAHCLREETDVGAEPGDTQALAACRAAITALYWQALATLDAAGVVDPDERTLQPEYLPFIGKTQIPVSGFYFFGGRAVHAIQDSFTHTYRRMDGADPGRRITSIFNWSSQVRGDLVEAENGHGHETILDDCEDDNPSNGDRVRWASEASAAFLTVLTDPGDAALRQMRLDAFFADWMTYEAGCSIANEYCDNPVQAWLRASGASMNYDDSGCAMAGRTGAGNGAFSIAGVVLAALLLRRRRRGVATLIAFAAAALGATAARADSEHVGWRAEARASLSVQNPAYAFGGAGAFAWRRAELGGFAELNPWYDANREMWSLGATNFGVFTHYLHSIRPDVRIRAGIGLGLSVLNQDLPGTSAGNVGLYANIRLLGVVWYFANRTALTIDAFDLALPAPQLRGWPVLYAQHRISVGLSF
jgi:hypothetical protein